jgi:spermidine synthase
MTANPKSPKAWMVLLLLALFGSGVASIINQVIWQRALKIYLAGSEAVSAMIVVLVFMLGLGLGSEIMGRRAKTIANPLKAFAAIELLLCLLNLGICFLLSLDLRESIYALQRLVVSLGIPLKALYAITAAVLLSVPCILMGMTVPVASEGCQRQLGVTDNRFLSLLFFLNTVGALVGAILSGFVILPLLGQQAGLLVAVSMNAGASLLAGLLSRKVPQGAEAHSESEPAIADNHGLAGSPASLKPALVLGFTLGLLSLAYEMYLFRIGALISEPLPWIFSLVLALFLLTWSLGVFAAGKLPVRVEWWLFATAATVGLVPILYRLARWESLDWPNPFAWRVGLFALCFVPCFFFGVLFTQIIARFARSWGRDVGYYFAANTFGSCLGVLLGTLIGFEFPPEGIPWAIFLGLSALLAFNRYWSGEARSRFIIPAVAVCGVMLAAQIGWWFSHGRSFEPEKIVDAYYGRGGVVEIDAKDNLSWDGLWHSAFANGENYVGTNNWKMAVVPLLCHNEAGKTPLDVCVIGLGTGITTGTLAESSLVESVDSYEINEELRQMIDEYREGTLHVADHPKVRHYWADGRSGLALNDQSYDLITQQPLYLKQAGSSILLSKEYMELVKSRLKPGGIFCIYCNALGNEFQARMVRATAAEVFSHCESFRNGYMIVASDEPFEYTPELIRERLAKDPFLKRQCEAHGLKELDQSLDKPRLRWDSPHLITDDHPLVEYPLLLGTVISEE